VKDDAENKKTTSKTLIGDSGFKAEVTEENKNPKSIEGQRAASLIKRAGSYLCPVGFTYKGFAVVHFFEKQAVEGPEYSMACQTEVKEVNEGHADIGWKSLRSALMNAYGRSDPRNRQ